jgi:trehalose 6-phosphate synthase/phosphatase
MPENIESLMNDAHGAEVFTCTVGQKPSKAKYYLDDTIEVIKILQGLASASDPSVAPFLPHFADIASFHM